MNAVVIRGIDDAKNFIGSLKKPFENRAIDSGINFAREAGFICQALQNNNFLMTTAMNNPESLKNTITNVAAVNLTLNPAEKLCYAVPLDGKVTLFVSYMGFAHLATKSGAVSFVQVELVYEKDTFEMRGIDQEPVHTRDPFSTDRGKIVGGYCCAKLPSGDYLTTTMTIGELNKIKDSSKAKNGPWKTWPEEMYKKTLVKRASKLWPAAKDNRLATAIDLANQDEGIDFDEQGKIAEKEMSEKREVINADMRRKNDLVDEIKELSSKLTEGLDLASKGVFMSERLMVRSFNDLKLKNVVELEDILTGLKEPMNE